MLDLKKKIFASVISEQTFDSGQNIKQIQDSTKSLKSTYSLFVFLIFGIPCCLSWIRAKHNTEKRPP